MAASGSPPARSARFSTVNIRFDPGDAGHQRRAAPAALRRPATSGSSTTSTWRAMREHRLHRRRQRNRHVDDDELNLR